MKNSVSIQLVKVQVKRNRLLRVGRLKSIKCFLKLRLQRGRIDLQRMKDSFFYLGSSLEKLRKQILFELTSIQNEVFVDNFSITWEMLLN